VIGVDVFGDGDDLAPVIVIADADLLANGVFRRAPVFARKVLRDESDGTLLVRLGPSEVAACDEGGTHGGEVVWRDKMKRRMGGISLSR